MPPPTAHTPSGADLGGPVIVPVSLVTVPLSNNGAKAAAKPSNVSDYTTISVELRLYCRFTVRVMGFSLTKKSFLQVHQLEKHGNFSHRSISNGLVLPSGCLSIVKYKVRLTLCTCASKLRPCEVVC